MKVQAVIIHIWFSYQNETPHLNSVQEISKQNLNLGEHRLQNEKFATNIFSIIFLIWLFFIYSHCADSIEEISERLLQIICYK